MKRINYGWRFFATGAAFTVFGVGGLLIPIFALPILFILSATKEERQRRARFLVHKSFFLFVHMMKVLGVLQWKCAGLEKLERPGLLVLANHPTLLDVVFLVALMPNVNCIVKGQLLRNPAMRGYVSMAGYIFNNDGQGLIDSATKSLDKGTPLLMFPEGTRTRPKKEELHFLRGAAHIALKAQVAPTLVVIRCNPPTLSKQHQWYHIPDQKVTISIEVKSDLPIDTYLDLSLALGARQLTKRLQNYYNEELKV